MYALSKKDMNLVNGGVAEELFGIAEIDAGLTLGAAAGAVAGAAVVGWQIGSWINGQLEDHGL